MRSSAVYLESNASLSIKNNRLDSYQNTAPVHWGVNATVRCPPSDRRRLRPLCIGV